MFLLLVLSSSFLLSLITMMNSNHDTESKRQKSNLDEQITRNDIDRLPREIALDIASRLPVKSLVQFRFVCRSWHLLSHDPHLPNLQLQQQQAQSKKDVILLFHCDYPVRNELYFVEFSNQEHRKEVLSKFHIPFSASMPEFRVVNSSNGLLCLSNTLFTDPPYIYNPFTRKYKVLPKSVEFQDQEIVLGFGFHPITHQYKVIRIVYYWNSYQLSSRELLILKRRTFPQSEVQIFCQGSNKWRNIGEVPYKLEQSGGIEVNGRLHWLSLRSKESLRRRERRIFSFDLSDELFREVPLLENTVRNRLGYSISVLGEWLCIADFNYDGLDIWIMKEYGVKESWERTFRVPNRFPRFVFQEMQKPYGIWRNVLNQKPLRIVSLLGNGEILLQCRWGALVTYNPENGSFKNIEFQGMPKLFQTFPHIGGTISVDSA